MALSLVNVAHGYSFIELKKERTPDGVGHRMGFWKAEEYQKFAYPTSKVVLQGVLPEMHTYSQNN